jgi:hypothetical protein
MTSSRRALDYNELTRACYLAGGHSTVQEIGEDIGVSDLHAITQCLKLFNIVCSAKPFGVRQVNVFLSPTGIENLRTVARSQGIIGADGHQKLMEQAARRLAADPPLLRAVLDPNTRPIFVPSETMDGLTVEAGERGIASETLAGRLLEHIAKDQMVGAIMDDEAGSGTFARK